MRDPVIPILSGIATRVLPQASTAFLLLEDGGRILLETGGALLLEGGSPNTATGFLLLENGGKILLESGGGILLETSLETVSSISPDIVPILSIKNTQAVLASQGYAYDQAGFTYNQIGVDYGGVYNTNEDVLPILATIQEGVPFLSLIPEGSLINLVLHTTQALLYDQGYTYDQVGFSYDQVGIAYGGVYNQNEDSIPLSLSFTDIYSPIIHPIGNNQSLGPGFFMFITR